MGATVRAIAASHASLMSCNEAARVRKTLRRLPDFTVLVQLARRPRLGEPEVPDGSSYLTGLPIDSNGMAERSAYAREGWLRTPTSSKWFKRSSGSS
jgi:hypothetical protein